VDSADFGMLAAVAVRTGIVLVVLLVGLRLTGKRQAGEMNVRDIMLVMMIANAVQNGMTKGDGRLAVALVSSGTLILVGWIIATLLGRRPGLNRLVSGGPTVLVENGRAYRAAMRREGVSDTALMAAVRDMGLTDVAEVRLAVLESDGEINVIPRERTAHA
jgi:uncharacterized membrane protein YcaP (DUF421 family)